MLRRMRKWYASLVWGLPLLAYSVDALAWGLYTHVYFAQLLIWAIPLVDPRFRRAVQRFPELLLAGACLPDTALFSSHAAAPELRGTHQWSVAKRMLADGPDDETRALAVGYASHLLADVIAHNYFVPEHERLWFRCPVVTHAACEWAMDAHVAPQLLATPGELLRRYRARLAHQATRFVGCTEKAAARALGMLGGGERFLRATGVHHAALLGARALGTPVSPRFDDYVSETARRLRQINRVIAGESPAWNAEPDRRDGSWQQSALPQDLFQVAPGIPR